LVKTIQYYSEKPVMQAIMAVFVMLVLIGFGNSTYLRNGVWKTNGTLWADALEKAPDVIRPHLNLGNYYYTQKMYDMALSRYTEGSMKRSANNKTDTGLIFYNIGLIHHKMGNKDQALENYRKAAKTHPAHADTHNNIGLILYSKGQKKEAETELLKAIQCKTKHLKAHRNLALFSIKEGKLDEAVLWINKALEIAPDSMTVLGAAGYCYRLKGSFGRAFALFEKALEKDKYDPKVDLYMAEIFFKRKMYDQAIKHIEIFAASAKGKDLRGYVQGTYKKENELDVIRPYKKIVLFALSRAYTNQFSYLKEKADYLKTALADIE
jgi:Tfp pilus assembly protein PilF